MSEGNTNRQFISNDKTRRTWAKKTDKSLTEKQRAICTFFYGGTYTVKFTKKSLILAQDER